MNNLDKYIDRFFKVGLVIVLGFMAFQSQSSILGAQSNFSGPVVSTAGYGVTSTVLISSGGAWTSQILTSSTARFDNTVTANSSTFNGEITLGYCATATYNPGAVTSSTPATTSVYVANAAVGDIFLVGFSATTTDTAGIELVLTASVATSSGAGVTTTVQFSNPGIESVNASSGTLTVCNLN